MLYFDNDILTVFSTPFQSLFFMYLVGRSDDNGIVRLSLRNMESETKWNINAIRQAIKDLSELGTINTQSTQRGSVITICVTDKCKDKILKSTHSLHNTRTTRKRHLTVPDALTFESVWDLYQKKVGRCPELEEEWCNLPYETRELIFNYIPAYVALTEESYRMKFRKFLSQRKWLDENIYTNGIAVPFGSFNPKLVSDKNLFPQFVERFNMKVRGSGITTVDMMNGLTEKRRVLFNIAYCLHFYQIKDVIEKAMKNPRLNGSMGFSADFDYIFEPNNFLRISEGK